MSDNEIESDYEEINDDEEYFSDDNLDESYDTFELEKNQNVENNSKINIPIIYNRLTKYERASILGVRTQQLSNGAKPLINISKDITDIKLIAKMELEQNKIPLIISRPFPDGYKEKWKVSDLN